MGVSKRFSKNLLVIILLGAVGSFIWVGSSIGHARAISLNLQKTELRIVATNTCKTATFFGLIPWYQYLNISPDPNLPAPAATASDPNPSPPCTVSFNLAGNGGKISNLNEIWLVGLAVFDDLLRVAGMVAVVFVIYGGVRYITSQGEPEATKAAQGTIINALIGLAIAIVAATTVAFIGSSLGGK